MSTSSTQTFGTTRPPCSDPLPIMKRTTLTQSAPVSPQAAPRDFLIPQEPRKVIFISKVAHYTFKNLGHIPAANLDVLTEVSPRSNLQAASLSMRRRHENQLVADATENWIEPVFKHVQNQQRILSPLQLLLMVSASSLDALARYFEQLAMKEPEQIEFLVRFLDTVYHFYPSALEALSRIQDPDKKQLADFVAITSQTPHAEANVTTCFSLKHPRLRETRYLKQEVASQIFNAQTRQFTSFYVDYMGASFYLKTNPKQPLMDYALYSLSSLLGLPLTPYTQLLRLEVITGTETLICPLLLSRAIRGPNGLPNEPLTNQELNWAIFSLDQKKHWTLLFLFSALAHPQHYTLDANRKPFCIDNEECFSECIVDGPMGYHISFNSTPFRHFKNVSLDADTLQAFSNLNPKEILENWLQEVIRKQCEYSKLFDVTERQNLFAERSGLLTAEIALKEGVLANLFLQFRFLQDYLKRLADFNSVSPLQLLGQMVSLNFRSEIYRPLGFYLKKAVLEDRKAPQPFTLVQEVTPSFTDVTSFSLHKALNELHDLAELERDPSPNQRNDKVGLALKLLQDLSARMVLQGPTSLNLLNDLVQDLFIINVEGLTNSELKVVAQRCSKLKRLCISGCALLSEADFAAFKNLEILALESCSNLTSIANSIPSTLKEMHLFNNPLLGKLPLNKFEKLTISECPRLDSEARKKIEEALMNTWVLGISDDPPFLPFLETVFFMNQNLNVYRTKRLARCLSANPHIKKLIINLAELDDLGVDYFLSVFQSRDFEEIDLSSNKITRKGAEKILKATQNTSTTIKLQKNLLTQEEISELKRLFPQRNTLHGIVL